ncbi:MAG: Na(+)-translocating NADH-quinone reductase subunit A [Prevotellaceae bacterium]|jgi:Na+-transporting NADH:ubiquinone oxidoreductase subunit A|nr:Na(+)-translocating NADH-quinone reductase subunit A [Prevotellaceae bacterium]
MSKVVKIKKGLDIKLKGSAEKVLAKATIAESYAVKPTDFAGLMPKLVVKQGDQVKVGTPLFFDKNRPEIMFVSPVSGTVSAINRGERRKLLEVVVTPGTEQEYEKHNVGNAASLNREELIALMLKGGVWPFIKQRPYGIIANPSDTPKDIFISGFDTAPLGVDMDFILTNEAEHFQKGIDILKKLTPNKVHLGVTTGNAASGILKKVKGVESTIFTGPHPAGNVGVHINHIAPINKGEIVWTIDPQLVALLGRFFTSGIYNVEKIIAVAGSEVKRPQYFRIITGASLKCIAYNIASENSPRYISGNVLTGTELSADGFLGFYDNMISVIPEGNHHELFGWAKLFRPKVFSTSHAYLSFLTPNKKYALDTNLNGGERAFVMTGQYEKVLPMDIYPVYLLKAILAEDIDKMEQLGIYEVIEEDLALCEFVCTSKTEVQAILRKGIDLMIKEMS